MHTYMQTFHCYLDITQANVCEHKDMATFVCQQTKTLNRRDLLKEKQERVDVVRERAASISTQVRARQECVGDVWPM